jgi:trehalose 6-phosphate phosphatase
LVTPAHSRIDAVVAAATVALFLDLDGTLIDIAPTPAEAVPPAGLSGLLAALTNRLDGAVAILSGRTIGGIDRLLFPLRPRAAGAHGAEIREREGGVSRAAAPDLSPDFIDRVRRLSELDPRLLVEPKGAAIAVHYRQAPDMGAEVTESLRALLAFATAPLELRPGRMVVEVVHKNISKAGALTEFMRQPAFQRRRPIMIGDDVGDLDALTAAERFGGWGLRVAGEWFRQDEADFEGTAAVRQWLVQLAARIAAEQHGGDVHANQTLAGPGRHRQRNGFVAD